MKRFGIINLPALRAKLTPLKADPDPPPSLTIIKHRQDIIDKINANDVTIISASTGSGKTTQVPQFIYDDAIKRGVPEDQINIIVSQPRKIAAMTIAKRVSEERNCQLGELVGFQVGLSKKKDFEGEKTRILFCTTGVILEKLIQEKCMTNYSHVILDEVHEREIDMDLLITIVRDFQMNNSTNTKIILMSATFNSQDFVKYFTHEADGIRIEPSLVKLEEKKNFDIAISYLEDFVEKFHASSFSYTPGISSELFNIAVNLVKLQLAQKSKSILVFLPGIYEINTLFELLRNCPEIIGSSLICVLHSSLSTSEQGIAFKPASKPKIILSTNIAESSVTITDVDTVLDFCLTKHLLTSEDSAIASLKLVWTSKNSLDQRAGRTGRTCDGKVYRFITMRLYSEHLRDDAVPEILRAPLEQVVLRVKSLDLHPPMVLLNKAMNPPDRDAIRRAILVLKSLGGLERISPDATFDSTDGKLTYVGHIMKSLPIDVRIVKFIILSNIFSISEEGIIIGAGLGVQRIFRSSFTKKLDDFSRKLLWSNGSGCDFAAILNAYRCWRLANEQGRFKTIQDEEEWCDEFQLERKRLHEMHLLVEVITERLSEHLEAEPAVSWDEHQKPIIVKICVAGAFMPNFFITSESSEHIEKDIFKHLGGKNPNNTVMFKNMKKEYVGEVYSDQMSQKLVDLGICRKKNDVRITFDKGSTKVFVEFQNNSSMIDDGTGVADVKFNSQKNSIYGKISPEVYKAVKLRKLGERFAINVNSQLESEQFALKHGIGSMENGLFTLKANTMKLHELCVVPLTCDTELIGTISHIEHLGKFFVQPAGKDNKEILDQLTSALGERITTPYKNVMQLRRDQFVVVRHDTIMKRAKVTSIKVIVQTATCWMFDFGMVEEVPINTVYEISDQFIGFTDVPPRCFEACLSEIQPDFIKCPRGKWTIEAIEEFRRMALKREARFEVYSVVDDIASVHVFVDYGKHLNKHFIESGVAQKGEESFPSKVNHELRIENQRADDRYEADIEFINKLSKVHIMRIPSPVMSKNSRSLFLTGPHSPLETSIDQVLIDSSRSSLIIDPDSVNSITLIEDPGQVYGRLLVAASVTEGRNGVVLHETTLFPAIPDLAVLLGFIFAPDVIFRRSEDRTRYITMQFGLGADPETKLPYFAEQDCILPVNFHLDDEDFVNLNFLRFAMSYLLYTQPTEAKPSLSKDERIGLLAHIKHHIIEVLNKNRFPLASCYSFPDGHDWKTENQEDCTTWEECFDSAQYHHIAQPLTYKQDVKKMQRLLSNLEEVERIASISWQGANSEVAIHKCPLCNLEYEQRFSLFLHFSTKMHKQRKAALINVASDFKN